MRGRMRSVVPFLFGVALAAWTVTTMAQNAITTDGAIESTSGGFMFPDGSMQTTAAGGGGAILYATAFPGLNQSVWAVDNNRRTDSGALVSFPAPRAGTLKNLFVAPTEDQGSTDVTVAMEVNGVVTGLSVMHDGDVDGTSTVSNTADTVAVSQGETIIFKFTAVGDPPGGYKASVEFQ